MRHSASARKHATAGAAIWLAWALAFRPTWTACLLAFAPLVLVPLGLDIATRTQSGPDSPMLSAARRFAPIAAIATALAFVPDPGLLAATLTIPWLGLTALVAAIGVGRFLARKGFNPSIGVDAGLVLLAIGAAWFTISRAALRPLGFSDAIVELTAVHFHYAGFALPVVAGAAATQLRRTAVVPVLVAVAVPLTALGITTGGRTEWVAATFMATAGLAAAADLVRLGLTQRGPARGLLVSAGASLSVGMTLAFGWAWSVQFNWHYLELDEMARYHGTLNALGFGLLGLVGLHLTHSTADPPRTVSIRLRRPSEATLATLRTRASGRNPTSPPGLLDRPGPSGHRHDQWTCALPNGFDAGRDALRNWASHRAAGMTLTEPSPPIRTGETVAFAIPIGPVTITATCRIIDVVDEPDRYGFTYATLPHHPEDGEESFIIERHADGTTTYTVTAAWRPAILAARLAPPITRFIQQRATRHYLTGVATWTPTSPATRRP